MTFFNFSLRSRPALESETTNHLTLFQELEVWGHLLFATEICDTLNDMGIASIKITHAGSDYEGGIDIRLAEPIFTEDRLSESSVMPYATYDKWKISDLLGLEDYAIKGYVAIQLNPGNYEGYTLENNLENIMSLICTSEIYQLWKVLESKSALDTQISAVPGIQNKKPILKV